MSYRSPKIKQSAIGPTLDGKLMQYLLHLKWSVVVSFKTHNIYMTVRFEWLENQCTWPVK